MRVVVLTGGARAGGMGRAIAESFLRLGDAVVLSDVGAPLATHPDYEVAPPDHLQQAASELAALGPVLPVACDVTDEDQVVALFDAAVAEHGRVDVVVNCAGLAIGLTRAGGPPHYAPPAADLTAPVRDPYSARRTASM